MFLELTVVGLILLMEVVAIASLNRKILKLLKKSEKEGCGCSIWTFVFFALLGLFEGTGFFKIGVAPAPLLRPHFVLLLLFAFQCIVVVILAIWKLVRAVWQKKGFNKIDKNITEKN